MNLQQLRHFVTLAETGSFRKAAERLHMTQPPLSVSIRKLEEDLGLALFVRAAQGVTLTPAGESLLEPARSALFHLQQMRDVAQAVTAGEGGRLRIGFIGSAMFTLMPEVIKTYSRRYPGVRLLFEESTTESILARINDRALDLGLVRCPVYSASEIRIEQVEFDSLAVALPLSHRLAKKRVVQLSALSGEPFVLYSHTAVPNMHAMVVETCQRAGFVPLVAQEAVQIRTVLDLVESGLGVALVPALAAPHAEGRIVMRPLAGGVAHRGATGVALAYRPDRETAVSRRFRETVKEIAAGVS